MHPLLRAALLFCPAEFRRRFGAQISSDQREYRGSSLIGACGNIIVSGLAMRAEIFARDLGFALRSLAKAPAYTSVAVLAFALAIGANVAVASVLEAVVLRPLPFPQSDRLIFISQGPNLRTQISYRNARDIESRTGTLAGIGLLREDGATLTGFGRPAFVPGWITDGTYFSVLGVHASLGRVLDTRDLSTSNIVVSDRLWRTYLHSDPRAIGKVLHLDGTGYTIVGIMPPGYRDPLPSGLVARDFWVPVDKHSILAGSRVWTGFHGLGRVAPGAPVASAAADIKRVLAADALKFPQDFVGAGGATVVPVLEGMVGSTGTLLWMLYAAVGMVLAIACVNIANLTMARIGARERELVVRNALGAARARILTQLATELAVLAVAGGIIGTGIAYGGLNALRAVFSQVLPRWEGVALDTHVLGYAALLVIVTAAVTGVVPVFARSDDMTAALKSAGRGGYRGAGRGLRSGLVIAEVALAVSVVVCAGLVLRSFVALTHVDIGFNPRNLSVVTVTLPYKKYYSDPNAAASVSNAVTVFSHRVVNGLRAMPGVESASAAIILPFEWNAYPRAFTIPGRPDPHATVTTNAIGSRFFGTMQTRLLRGRDFDERDSGSAAPVAIVNASLAMRYFGTLEVLGKSIALTPFVPNVKPVAQTIVGVAEDTRTSYARAPEPQIYVPATQIPLALFYVVRTKNAAFPLAQATSALFAQIDPSVAPPSVESYSDLLSRDAVRSQAAMLLFGILAMLAFMLALAGIYAVTAYSVEQRTQEFGIRQAIGAHGSDVLRDVLRGALLQTVAGIASGLIVAALLGRFLTDLLFQVSPLDPATFGSVIALTVCAVTAASAIPALRAARIQPAAAIRYE